MVEMAIEKCVDFTRRRNITHIFRASSAQDALTELPPVDVQIAGNWAHGSEQSEIFFDCYACDGLSLPFARRVAGYPSEGGYYGHGRFGVDCADLVEMVAPGLAAQVEKEEKKRQAYNKMDMRQRKAAEQNGSAPDFNLIHSGGAHILMITAFLQGAAELWDELKWQTGVFCKGPFAPEHAKEWGTFVAKVQYSIQCHQAAASEAAAAAADAQHAVLCKQLHLLTQAIEGPRPAAPVVARGREARGQGGPSAELLAIGEDITRIANEPGLGGAISGATKGGAKGQKYLDTLHAGVLDFSQPGSLPKSMPQEAALFDYQAKLAGCGSAHDLATVVDRAQWFEEHYGEKKFNNGTSWRGTYLFRKPADSPHQAKRYQQQLLYCAFVGAALCRQIAPAPLLHTRGRRT
jgi:hypothetical protein